MYAKAPAKKGGVGEINMDTKYILVTGAYGGMGRATVGALAEKGYTVFALDKRVGEEENNVFPIVVDVTDAESIAAARAAVEKITNRLDAIIHFAGIYVLDSLVEISEERFHRIFDINVFGVYRINKEFLPLLKKGSRIVITTSELAPLEPLPFTGLYGITKSTLEKYAYSLRMELQLLGISVSVLRPGAVKTTLLGDSTRELDEFCSSTRLYTCNAERFRRIVESVEAKNVAPERVARLAIKAISAKKPRFVYNLNRNLLLLMLNILPRRLAVFIIKKILK